MSPVDERPSIFISPALPWIFIGAIQSPCLRGMWVKGRHAGREFAFQEHHVDVLADFNRVCSVRSAACHSSSSSLQFDLPASPIPIELPFRTSSPLNIQKASRSMNGLAGPIRVGGGGGKSGRKGRERRRKGWDGSAIGGAGIMLGKTRKLAPASFNIRFILFRVEGWWPTGP